jgi:hypothetical protein
MTFGSTFGRVFSPTFQPKSQAAASVSTFVPTDVSNMIIWIDFSDANYLFTDAGSTKVSSDGDAIYQANDKSGNDYHVVQATAGSRPLYKTNIQNSKSVARFDGSDDWMDKNYGATMSQPNTFFSVWKSNNAEGDVCYIYDGYGSSRQALLSSAGATPDCYYMFASKNFYLTTTPFPKGSFVIICALFYGANSTLWENSSSKGTGDTGADGLTGITLGARLSTHASPLDGDFCELIAYNKQLSDAERNNVFAYLNNKWAIY